MLVNSVTEAKAQLSALIERAMGGEEIIISRAGKPVAILKKYDGPHGPRRPGRLRGRIEITDDFDALPPELAEPLGADRP